MTDRGPADQNPFALWLENSRKFLAADTLPLPLTDRCEALFAAWRQFTTAYAEAGGAATARGGLFDPVGWLHNAGDAGSGDFGSWFASPDAADPWQAAGDALRGSQEWHAYLAALERYRAVLSAAWLRAFSRFATDLSRDNSADSLPDWVVIERRWREAADRELIAAQRSEEFLAAQRDLIRARLDCSAHLRDRVEQVAALLGMPTRAELDAVHRSLHAVRAELRSLRVGRAQQAQPDGTR